jgi:hypothetical protein
LVIVWVGIRRFAGVGGDIGGDIGLDITSVGAPPLLAPTESTLDDDDDMAIGDMTLNGDMGRIVIGGIGGIDVGGGLGVNIVGAYWPNRLACGLPDANGASCRMSVSSPGSIPRSCALGRWTKVAAGIAIVEAIRVAGVGDTDRPTPYAKSAARCDNTQPMP